MPATRTQLRTHIKRIVHAAPDLSQLTRRIVKDALVEECGVDAGEMEKEPCRGWIKELIGEAVSEVEQTRAAVKEEPAKGDEARSDDADGISSMDDSDSAAPPAKKRSKAGAKASASKKPRASSSTLPPESDMSSLDDSDGGAPRKRAKGEKKEKGKAKAKGAKHESELKRLQSYVNACGSRRQWKRLYAAEGIAEDDEKAQCALVRRVLDDLGMPSRCSMKEAKRIREEREFKMEVEEIQDSTLLAQGNARSSRSKTSTRKKEEREHDDSESDEGVSRPKKKRAVVDDLAAFAAELNSE